MTKYYLAVLLMRLVLPAGLLLSIAIRPFGISLVYLLLYLLSPLAQIPNTKTFSGWRGQILVLTLLISSVLLLSHAVFHSTLAAFAPYGSLLDEYPLVKHITCNLGYVSYAHIDPLVAVHYVAPELVMLGTSLIVYVAVKKLIAHAQPGESINVESKHQKYPILASAGKYVCLFLLMFSGVMRPSITSGIYFLVFIGAITAWSLGQPLKNGFAVIGRCVMGIMAVHILVLIVYQFNWLIGLYPPEQQFARYFGLTRLVYINETSDSGFTYTVTDDHEWATIVSPFVILFTYFVLGIETRELFKPKAAYKYIDSKALRGSPPRETTPLMRSISPSKRLTNMSMRLTHRHLHQDSTGSVVVPDDESIAEQEEPTLIDDIIAAIIDFFQISIRSSYIATTITMMAWSIMFHSWLAFVFLMWANIVWLCPNQRSFMLKTSPVLVCYAVLLLLVQYIYGMDLTQAELPSEVPEVNLRQIGVNRPDGSACVPLMIKSLFTCMFWVTLRQRVQDIHERRHSAVITEMAAPLQLTVSTAASAIESRGSGMARSRLMRALGERLRAACARYWIYVVVIMLFVIGITGERMTIFRILYMFLFLGFILMFQISWYWWRRLMYVFWITVIIYSMLNLILIYVYQFDELSKIIADYLYINEKLQHDLGLEQYTPADLFVKLLTPTLFLIITIMQVHYFHKDFMALSEPKTTTNSVAREAGSSRPSQGGASTIKDEVPALPLEEEQESGAAPADHKSDKEATEIDQSIELSTLNTAPKKSIHRRDTGLSRQLSGASASSRRQLRAWAASRTRALRAMLLRATDQLFISLDVHLIKIIFIAVMLLCVINVCAMHVPIMIIISIGLLMSQKKQRFIVLLISTLISVYFMAKMVYQIDYISHSYFDVNCTLAEGNETNEKAFNNAEWLGFLKMTHEKPLVTLLKGYIGLIVLFTFYSLVTYRQQAIRKNESVPKTKNKLMFPNVTRKDADKDLTHCVKYLLNYGFYKFGVEICLMCLVGVIGSRMDVYAVLYAGWLLVLVSSRRMRQSQLWPTFTIFIMVLVPIQYMISVGFVPQFCINYPWNGEEEQMKHIRTWLFLPYATTPPHASKLIFDYFLLLFASRQLIVFRIEKSQGDSYKGGSNREDIGTDWEKPTFVNPVPDFLSVGNWLDVVKRMVFLGMLWVTLAIMFLTGTNRVNLFSMGYLIGSFIFLWQGTDFYLRPKESILQWWSWLVRYNVCVVVVKALLQIPGCLFSALVQEHACWLVQLLGIGCVDKFAGGNIAHFLKMGKYNKESKCTVPQEDIGLAWDGVCFAFLILQRRLFHSYYFYRVIDESKATTVLASRGAELIEELRQKQMRLQEEQEIKILEKIKIKMERIKANQKKIQTVAKDVHHDAEEEVSETQRGEDDAEGSGSGEQAPLVRGDSDASRRGYHTPDSPASPRGFHTPLSEPSAPPSPARSPPPPAPPALPPPPPSSQGGPPSPSSALMTVSLDAYLEPRRISFESPVSSHGRQSPEESYPVFSPPPIRRRHTVAASVSHSSRAEPHSHHTSLGRSLYRPPATHQQAVRSGDYYMFDEFDDTEVHLKDDESSEDEDGPKEMGIGKLLSTVFKSDLRHAVRRASAPNVRGRIHSLGSYSQTRSRAEVSQHSDVNVTLTEREHDEVCSELEEYAPSPDEETKFETFKRYIETVNTFVSSFLISVTRFLMKYSRDYRYVSRTLTVEKRILKEKEGFGIGIREGSQMIWEPLPETIVHHRKLSEISVPEIRILAPSMERGLDRSPLPLRRAAAVVADSDSDSDTDTDDTSEHESAFSLRSTSSKDVTTLEEQDDSMFKHKAPIVRLGLALWYAILAHTDIVCYVMVFVNQIQSATILSIPLPLMVFLWGTLTIPRPTKTFWVTLIAYTEVIVLIKSMFQFEILPWNLKATPEIKPFTAPRIIGIERKPNYAIYDLLLLLIIFLHRFMLKSLGLWKESTPEVELREDTEYELTAEDTQLIVEGRGDEVGRKYIKLHDHIGPSEDDDDGRKMHPTKSQFEERSDEEKISHESEQAGPSKPLDDDHFKVDDDQEPIIAVKTTLEENYKYYPNVVLLSLKRYLRPMKRFFKRMLAPGARVTADVYAYMFLCDFFNFLVVIFGFAAFGTQQGDGGVQAYLEENKVPIPFLVMLILQFVLIVVDRALYLRKFILGKILFQYALIIGVHVWMFFVLPFITERTFNTLLPPPMWYMMKCLYLLLSAYQIRCGYPRRIIGNFLCKSYRFINMVFFRGFMAVPFVFELRTLMDWIWTDTSMTLMDWLKMEDIFASVFLLKCSRYIESEFPQPRGQKKSNMSKYILGGGVLVFVIAIIWFPLVFFAFGNSVGQPNPPTDVTVKIRIGPFLPIYQMSAQSHNIDVYTDQEYTQLSNLYARDRTAQTFLANYMYNDVAVISINPNSTMTWDISPPELERLKREANSNASLTMKFSAIITHETNSAQNQPSIEYEREVRLEASPAGGAAESSRRAADRAALVQMLDGTAAPDTWLTVKMLFPKFVKVFNKGVIKPANQLIPNTPADDDHMFRDVLVRLEREGDAMYWRVREICESADRILISIPKNNCEMLVMFTFNDKLFPETLNFISASGIIGLYTTFVFLASRVLRGFFSGIYNKIMFDDLPNVDRVLQLCLDIYLVREALELSLEEDLFAKLVFLYRSPETMIKWSRPKDEIGEEQRALPPSR